MQPLPEVRPLPLVQAAVAGRPRAEAELERQVPPGDPRVQDKQDPLQGGSIIQPLATGIAKASLPHRQQRLNQLPQLIRDDPRRSSHPHPSQLDDDTDGLRRREARPFILIRVLSARAGGACRCRVGGANGTRTRDLLHAEQALSQLSYGPETSPSSVEAVRRSRRKSSAQFTPRSWLFRAGARRSWTAVRPEKRPSGSRKQRSNPGQ